MSHSPTMSVALVIVLTCAGSPLSAKILPASSCAEINARILEAGPGDEVVVAAGSYDNCSVDVSAANGTAAAPIALRAQSTGGARFTGNGTRLRVTRDHWVIEGFVWDSVAAQSEAALHFDGCSHTVLRRNVFRNCTADYEDGRFVHYYGGAHGNTIERNEITGPVSKPQNPYWLILNATSDDLVTDTIIRRNHVHDIAPWGWVFNLGAHGAAVLESRTRIEENLFEDIGAAIHIKTSNNIVQNNTFRRTDGLDVRAGAANALVGNYLLDVNHRCSGCGDIVGFWIFGKGNIIRNNYVEGGDGGVDLGWGEKPFPDYLWTGAAGQNTSWAATESEISNNTFVECAIRTIGVTLFRRREWVPGVVADIPPTDNSFARNLIVNSQGVAVDVEGLGQNWSDNVAWSTSPGVTGEAPPGIERSDPQMQARDDGILVSSAFPTRGARPPCPPLKPSDVGPDSVGARCDEVPADDVPEVEADAGPTVGDDGATTIDATQLDGDGAKTNSSDRVLTSSCSYSANGGDETTLVGLVLLAVVTMRRRRSRSGARKVTTAWRQAHRHGAGGWSRAQRFTMSSARTSGSAESRLE